ncbi:unnamed protein product [Rhizopus stolonifer]
MHKKEGLETKKAFSLRPVEDEDNVLDDDQVKQDAQKMDTIMRQLLGGADEEEKEEEEEEEEEEKDQDMDQAEEEFSFRLFANKPLAKVNIVEEEEQDNAQLVSDLQQVEFDETDPEFQARVNQVAVDYMTIMKQSTVPYPTLQLPHCVTH